MVYWKLDERTIRCLINKEEIRKMGFDLNEISRDASLMSDFLTEIIKDSLNYLDWDTENGVQKYIARALPADQFLITISCTFPDEAIDQDLDQMLRILKTLNRTIPQEKVDKIRSLSGEEKEMAFAELSMDLLEECIKDHEEVKDRVRKEEEQTRDTDKLPAQCLIFHSMDELMRFGSLLDRRYAYSSLLYRLHDDYILLVDFGPADDRKDIIRFMITAEEYGAECSAADLTGYYLEEHGRLLIPENALMVLKSLAG